MSVVTGVVAGMMVVGAQNGLFVTAKHLIVVGARLGDLTENAGVERSQDGIELRRSTAVRRVQQAHQMGGHREMQRPRGSSGGGGGEGGGHWGGCRRRR